MIRKKGRKDWKEDKNEGRKKKGKKKEKDREREPLSLIPASQANKNYKTWSCFPCHCGQTPHQK